MITTIFLIILIAFEICYLTSKQYKQTSPPVLIAGVKSKPLAFRVLAALLFVIALSLLIFKLGWASGIMASIVCLMAAGSLVVTIHPFQYFKLSTIAILYFSILLLEIFI